MKSFNWLLLNIFYVVVIMVLLLVLTVLPYSNAANINGTNYKNVTVRTNVNISNSKPEVLVISIYQDTNSSVKNITLSAGSIRVVTCNASLRDWNSYSDIVNVTGYFWDNNNSAMYAIDDNNTHYSNLNCSNSGNGANYTVNYLCTFNVLYYANNGTWNCSVNATDYAGTSGMKSNYTTIIPIYAVNITEGVDYGNVPVEDWSGNRTANITNFGNRPLNITVEGYGAKQGDGLAMNCSLGGNITVGNEKFSSYEADWNSMTPLTSYPQNVANITIVKQTNPGVMMTNSTYWQLYVSSVNNPGGNCTGYIIFSAETS